MKKLFLGLAIAAFPVAAMASPVDLSAWQENGLGGNGAGTWTLQGANDSVLQSRNGAPTVFFDPAGNAQGTQLSGTIEVQTFSDDDFVGFVLGYQDGEINSANADFWLIDWKQGIQSAPAGLALSQVSGDLTMTSSAFTGGWWNHGIPSTARPQINEVARGTNLGSTGWADNTVYTFDLVFTSSLIEVIVDGVTEISYAGNFTDGSFGFYNFSQQSVEYAGITSAVLPPSNVIPLPAGAWLLLSGMGLLGAARLRRKTA